MLSTTRNRAWPPARDETQGRRSVVLTLLILVHLVLFVVPVVFVLLVGPAAIAIAENLNP